MSGKFHKAWGEFGGFKYAGAIQYEAAAMISFGVACNFGDQLHPSGEMDVETYENIGQGFSYVEKIEEYGPGGKPYSRLGLWLTLDKDADAGMSIILLENHQDFVIADETNLDSLKELVIPSKACLTAAQAEAIGAWVKRGGKLLVIHEGAMDQDKKRFIVDVGAEYQGPSTFSFDYTVVKPPIAAGLVTTPFLNYKSGMLHQTHDGHCARHDPRALFRPDLWSIFRTCQHALQAGGFHLSGGGAEWQCHLPGACARPPVRLGWRAAAS